MQMFLAVRGTVRPSASCIVTARSIAPPTKSPIETFKARQAKEQSKRDCAAAGFQHGGAHQPLRQTASAQLLPYRQALYARDSDRRFAASDLTLDNTDMSDKMVVLPGEDGEERQDAVPCPAHREDIGVGGETRAQQTASGRIEVRVGAVLVDDLQRRRGRERVLQGTLPLPRFIRGARYSILPKQSVMGKAGCRMTNSAKSLRGRSRTDTECPRSPSHLHREPITIGSDWESRPYGCLAECWRNAAMRLFPPTPRSLPPSLP